MATIGGLHAPGDRVGAATTDEAKVDLQISAPIRTGRSDNTQGLRDLERKPLSPQIFKPAGCHPAV